MKLLLVLQSVFLVVLLTCLFTNASQIQYSLAIVGSSITTLLILRKLSKRDNNAS